MGEGRVRVETLYNLPLPLIPSLKGREILILCAVARDRVPKQSLGIRRNREIAMPSARNDIPCAACYLLKGISFQAILILCGCGKVIPLNQRQKEAE